MFVLCRAYVVTRQGPLPTLGEERNHVFLMLNSPSLSLAPPYASSNDRLLQVSSEVPQQTEQAIPPDEFASLCSNWSVRGCKKLVGLRRSSRHPPFSIPVQGSGSGWHM